MYLPAECQKEFDDM